jgi:hypothetical protein
VGPTVADLREVLAGGYPTRYRMRRAKWALRRRVRSVRTTTMSEHGRRVPG